MLAVWWESSMALKAWLGLSSMSICRCSLDVGDAMMSSLIAPRNPFLKRAFLEDLKE